MKTEPTDTEREQAEVEAEIRRLFALVYKLRVVPMVMICIPLDGGDDTLKLLCMEGVDVPEAHALLRKVLDLPTDTVVTNAKGTIQ